MPRLGAVTCLVLAGGAAAWAADCYTPADCSAPTSKQDEKTATVEVTATGDGFIQVTDGTYVAKTTVHYNHGANTVTATKSTWNEVTCTQKRQKVGATAKAPGRGQFAGDGQCGTKALTPKTVYNVSAGAEKWASETLSGDTTATIQTCGEQPVSDRTCQAGL